jgi:hypothetical protein
MCENHQHGSNTTTAETPAPEAAAPEASTGSCYGGPRRGRRARVRSRH